MLAYRNMPIKRKLMFMIMLTSGLVLALACATLILYESVQMPKEMAADLTTLAQMTAANTTVQTQNITHHSQLMCAACGPAGSSTDCRTAVMIGS